MRAWRKTVKEQNVNLLADAGLAGVIPESQLAKRAIREGILRDEQEAIDRLLVDIKDSRNRFWWVSPIPRMQDLRRAYWIFLLLCLGNSRSPPAWCASSPTARSCASTPSCSPRPW